jgi:hypothetical protein
MLNPSWDDLTDELEHIRSRAPLHAKWLAYEGSEAYGIWQLSPDLPEQDERRASFSLFAAHVIAKCGVLPVPVPKPLEHCPHWRSVCEAGSKRTAPRGVPRLLAELEHQKSRSHEGYRYPHITPCGAATCALLSEDPRTREQYLQNVNLIWDSRRRLLAVS